VSLQHSTAPFLPPDEDFTPGPKERQDTGLDRTQVWSHQAKSNLPAQVFSSATHRNKCSSGEVSGILSRDYKQKSDRVA